MTRTGLARIFAVGLAALALWPLAGAFHWLGVNVATLEQMSRTDPFGLRVFPAALMFLRPLVAVIAAFSAIYTAWALATSHPLRAARTLMNGAGTQVLFSLTLLLTGPPVNATLTRLLPMFENRRTPGAFVRPDHFVLLQQSAGTSIVRQLFGVAFACAAAGFLARFFRVEAASPAHVEVNAAPPAHVPPIAMASLPTAGNAHMKQDSYTVRPRIGRWAALLPYNNDYDIKAIAHARSNQETFSYSMSDGVLRRMPDGEILLTLATRDGSGGAAYNVRDGSGQPVAALVCREKGWDIRDMSGKALAEITREHDAAGAAFYIARSASSDICRYTWSTGAGPMNPLLLVDFESRTTFDRTLALALAPYLEQEARLLSAKRFHSHY